MLPQHIFEAGFDYAIYSSIGGCILTYANKYKNHNRIRVSCFILDIISAIFMGYLAYWYMIELGMKEIDSLIVCCVIGNSGSKIFNDLNKIVISKLQNIILRSK